jgi:nucleoside-diphosphate-sugar epimerase
MKEVLITGDKGFVGRYFWKKLNDGNHRIMGVDKVNRGDDCRFFFKHTDKSYDLVIHLAAIVGGRESIEGRPLAVADNFSIDSEFFQWCLRTKPKKVVYFSSSAAYPVSMQTAERHAKLSESMSCWEHLSMPDMTYGASKLIGEYLASFADNVHIFRPFSGYGTDQDLSYPFPMYVKRAMERANPFEVWGTGLQTRDFIHIRDIVDAVMVAVDEGITGPINLGWGRSTSFLELAQMCMDAVGYEGEIVTRPDKPVGCMHRVSNNEKMLEFYTPKITLEEGIDMAVKGIL